MGLFGGGRPVETGAGLGQPNRWVPPESREETSSFGSRNTTSSSRDPSQSLYSKLDLLEKKWQSHKSQKRVFGKNKRARTSSCSSRKQPEPNLTNTFSTEVTVDSDKQPIGHSESFTSTMSKDNNSNMKKMKKSAPRVVSMFDRLYQKGKARSITPRRIMEPQSVLKSSRNRKRQLAATLIQAGFRGRRVRKRVNHQVDAASKMQRWWRCELHDRLTAANRIQRWWRCALNQLLFLKLYASVIIVQSLERRRVAIQAAKKRRVAIYRLQGQWRIRLARQYRNQLAEALERKIRESETSVLIQRLLVNHLTKLRQQHVECESLMVEESPSDEMEGSASETESDNGENHRCVEADVANISLIEEVEVTSDQFKINASHGRSIDENDFITEAEFSVPESDSVKGASPADESEIKSVEEALVIETRPSNEYENDYSPSRKYSGSMPNAEDGNENQVTVVKVPERTDLQAPGHTLVVDTLKQTVNKATGSHPAMSDQSLPPEIPKDKDQTSDAAPVSLYRAAQFRRRAKQASQNNANQSSRNRSCASAFRKKSSTPRKFTNSIAYEYLPTKKSYWIYDAKKLALVPIIQRWARRRWRMKLMTRASVKIQSIWRVYRAQSLLISSCLLKEWSVRVDFHQEGTTNNPILRQKVRLLALTKAIRRVKTNRLPQIVLVSPCSFVVDWKTKISIYFGEEYGREELNRCVVHVTCAAHRHLLWERWSSQKKFSLLSKAALMKSFANQCARLSRASVYLQSLKMRRILLKMAREKDAAVTIQRFWRRCIEEIPEARFFQEAKVSSLRLQSWWRMCMSMQMWNLQYMSACNLQASYRCYAARKRYVISLGSVVVIQSLFRGHHQRRLSQRQWAMAIEIQRAVRGFNVRNQLLEMDFAACAIQGWYRAIALRLCLWKIRHSYLTLQSLMQKQALLRRLQQEQSAVRLQSWMRMCACKSLLSEHIETAIIIQSVYRGHQARRTYTETMAGLIAMQALFRGQHTRSVLSKQLNAANAIIFAWRQYQQHKQAYSAVRLQSWMRMCACKCLVSQQIEMATVIQSGYRRYQARKTFLKVTVGLIAMQALFRGKHTRSVLSTHLIASNTIIFAWRQHQWRRHTHFAVQLQSWMRMCACKHLLLEHIQRVTVIQSAYRRYQARKSFSKTMAGLCTIQAWFRGIHMQSVLSKCRSAANTIIIAWRQHQCRQHFRSLQASMIIQCLGRKYLAQRKFQMIKAAQTIQTFMQRHVEERRIFRLYLSAITVQKICRRHEARKRYKAHLKAQTSAFVIQLAWDRYRDRKAIALYQSIVLIQKVWRGYQVRRVPKHAARIQKIARGHLAHNRWRQVRAAALKTQVWWRGIEAKRHHQLMSEAATNIQAFCRGFVTRACIQKEVDAVIVIQSWFRSILCVEKIKHVSASSIQAWYRDLTIRRDSPSEDDLSEVRKWDRAAQARSYSLGPYTGVQERVSISGSCRRQDSILISDSSISLHDFAEGSFADVRKEYQLCSILTFPADKSELSATMLQAAYRTFVCRQSFVKTRSGVIAVQRLWRAFLKKEGSLFTRAIVQDDAIEVERTLRPSHIAWLKKLRMIAAILVQSWWRTKLHRRRYLLISKNATKQPKNALLSQETRLALWTATTKPPEVASVSPFFFFDPDAMFSFPMTIATCLSVHGMSILPTVGQTVTKDDRNLARAVLIQRWFRKRQQQVKQKEAESAKTKMMISPAQDPITRAQALYLMRLIVSNVRIMQTWWRQRLHRIHEVKEQKATLIEAAVRGFRSRRELRRIRSALVLQRQYHVMSLRAKYHFMRNGFLCLQREWARYAAQPAFQTRTKTRNRRLAILQRQAKEHFQLKTVATIKIQRQWRFRRGVIALQRLAKRQFQEKVTAILILQKSCRMVSQRSTLGRSRLMTTRLQAQWRRFASHRLYKMQLSGFKELQQRAKQTYQKKNLATLIIQRNWRMASSRFAYRQKQFIAMSFQKEWRQFSRRTAYQKLIRGFSMVLAVAKLRFAAKTRSAVLIQRCHRMKRTHCEYRKMYTGFVTTQKLAKERFEKKTVAAILFQRQQRMCTQFRAYNQIRVCCILIQAHVRRAACHAAYGKMHRGFISIQNVVHQMFVHKSTASLTIQRYHRMKSALRMYEVARRSAICLQSRWRTVTRRSQYKTMYGGFTRAQVLVRQRFEAKARACIKLQRRVRMGSARSKYECSRMNASRLQNQWRLHFCQTRYRVQIRGFRAVQFRGKQKFELKTRSIILLQRQWRMVSAKSSFRKARSASIMMESQCRGFVCRSHYGKMRKGFITLQGLAKLWFRIKNTCAAKIQSAARRMAGRKRFLQYKLAVVKVQCQFRGFVQRRNFAVLNWLRSIAATMIASWWRRIVHESKYQKFLSATIVLQNSIRKRRENRAALRIQSCFRRSYTRMVFLRQRSSAFVVAKAIRRFLNHCRRRHAAATTIQRAWVESQERFLQRCLLVLAQARAAIDIQRWWAKKMKLSHRRQKLSSDAKEIKSTESDMPNTCRWTSHAAKPNSCDLVSMFCNFDLGALSTGLSVSNLMPWGNLVGVTHDAGSKKRARHPRVRPKKIRSAVLIQRSYRQVRSKRTKENYFRSIAAAWIQCIWRGHKARQQYRVLRMNEAASTIQRGWRRYQVRRSVNKVTQALRVQLFWRAYKLKSQSSAMTCRIQAAYRMHRQRTEFQRQRTAAISIQVAVRHRRTTKEAAAAAKTAQPSWWFISRPPWVRG